MPTNSPFLPLDMSAEVLEVYQNALRGTTVTSSEVRLAWTDMASNSMFVPQEPNQKARERADLKQLIATGQSDLKMYSDGERLVVKGFDIDNVRTLFILDDAKMLAPKKRTTHLKALLTKLAQREGVELEFTNQLPNFRCKQIVYWPFKLEVDDSALLQAKPAERIERPEPDEEGDEESFDLEESFIFRDRPF